jgi:hypothetical protein
MLSEKAFSLSFYTVYHDGIIKGIPIVRRETEIRCSLQSIDGFDALPGCTGKKKNADHKKHGHFHSYLLEMQYDLVLLYHGREKKNMIFAIILNA